MNKILQQIEAYCAVSEKCVADVLVKLQKMGVEDAYCGQIIEKLKENNFLNEQRFCDFYVRDKFRFNRWGKIKIAYMLSLKKIDKETINHAIDKIDKEEYLSVLKNLLSAKSKTIKVPNNYQKEAKLFKFAISHGFESDIIKQCLN
ncbi:MAG: RecX family transcriptional regulator [Prevotellaceae bacterium]|jgi:regulatory protein|nr:RecX family transcriptional regulator [Prevotellaceae bacterium]